MFKKICLMFIILISFFSINKIYWYENITEIDISEQKALTNWLTPEQIKQVNAAAKVMYPDKEWDALDPETWIPVEWWLLADWLNWPLTELVTKYQVDNKESSKISREEMDVAREKACETSKACIDKATFEINVDNISPWMNHIKGDTNKTINFALGTIIQKLMIGLGSLSLLIMTVWAWYIVLHGWQDELLNKWKSIFMSGIYAMLVALSSYYLIVIVRYVLYA